MLGGYILSALGGILLSVPLNLLADYLPRRSGSALDDLADVPGLDESDASRPIVRYVVVALLMAASVAYLWSREGLTPSFGILTFYMAVFALVGIIDVEHRLILSIVVLPAFAFAILEVLLGTRIAALSGFAGYAIAQIVVMAFYLFGEVYLWFINRGKPPEERVEEVAFGFGDVSLATFCGFVVGFPSVIPMLVLMVLSGAAFAILYVIIRALTRHDYQAHTALPYGPAILVAATLMLLWGPSVARLMGAQ